MVWPDAGWRQRWPEPLATQNGPGASHASVCVRAASRHCLPASHHPSGPPKTPLTQTPTLHQERLPPAGPEGKTTSGYGFSGLQPSPTRCPSAVQGSLEDCKTIPSLQPPSFRQQGPAQLQGTCTRNIWNVGARQLLDGHFSAWQSQLPGGPIPPDPSPRPSRPSSTQTQRDLQFLSPLVCLFITLLALT